MKNNKKLFLSLSFATALFSGVAQGSESTYNIQENNELYGSNFIQSSSQEKQNSFGDKLIEETISNNDLTILLDTAPDKSDLKQFVQDKKFMQVLANSGVGEILIDVPYYEGSNPVEEFSNQNIDREWFMDSFIENGTLDNKGMTEAEKKISYEAYADFIQNATEVGIHVVPMGDDVYFGQEIYQEDIDDLKAGLADDRLLYTRVNASVEKNIKEGKKTLLFYNADHIKRENEVGLDELLIKNNVKFGTIELHSNFDSYSSYNATISEEGFKASPVDSIFVIDSDAIEINTNKIKLNSISPSNK